MSTEGGRRSCHGCFQIGIFLRNGRPSLVDITPSTVSLSDSRLAGLGMAWQAGRPTPRPRSEKVALVTMATRGRCPGTPEANLVGKDEIRRLS